MSEQLHVVVLAAGQGKRMKSDRPKVLAKVARQPMLAHVLSAARGLDPEGLHVVVGHGADLVREAFPDPEITWVHQQEQLGTGHAVMMALPAIPAGSRVLVLLGDTPLIRTGTLRALMESVDATGLSILTAHLDDPSGYGRIVRDNLGHVKRIVEHRDADWEVLQISEINSGMMIAPQERLAVWLDALGTDNAQGEYYLTDIVELARAEKVKIHAMAAGDADEILGVNDRFQLAGVERIFQLRLAHALCNEGVSLADPARIDVRGDLTVDGEVEIDVGCVFEGENRLGSGCRIGPHCVLTDCDLGPDTRVHPHSVLEGVVTEGDCDIGPFARLRPGTRLAAGSKIGNFVETKKAEIGPGSKVNHLSYVGDAWVGAKVNIGAGTITCNYDGANKYRTEIGDGAFIGSDTQLVAPVKVGAGATIGAGSTITKDAPDGQLTLSRAKQISVEGWTRPTKKSRDKT
ncbi:MAG: bifunctional UDP-N-acetylglucosamine diphosphorylase/glucosamine-1-phosphate N-acetyltransferase GlmU [Xanthomonadales bacterium]|nr:bifunctional UDP-N-acetylglucosamine diphosphorylase/glucosamine-1-phosphate N-acetyltransferase GlmU [Xanthomonadales bacterium]